MKTTILPAMTAVLALVAQSNLFAQNYSVFPAEYERAWGRGSTSALGGNSTRTQMVFANPFAAGTTVIGIGLRSTAGTADRAAFTADVEVRMSSTLAVPGALSSTFANNVGTDVLVALPRQIVNILDMPANRSTGRFAEILFTTPFVFGQNGAPNILVELLVYSRSAGASWSTDRAFASASGRASTAGRGCGAGTIGSTSSGGTYVSGATIDVTLTGATPMSSAFLFLSLDQKELFPAIPLPVSLIVVGAALDCELLVRPDLPAITFGTDVNGNAVGSFPIPGGVGRFGVGWQWLYLGPPTPMNPVGLFTTADRATWIGPEVVIPDAQYVWDLFDVNSATGNSTTDSVPIVEFITQ